MVDSIHRAGRIGVVAPPGQLRKDGRRGQHRKDSHEDSGPESQATEEKMRADNSDADQGTAHDRDEMTTPSDKQNNRPTGRRIDVRI